MSAPTKDLCVITLDEAATLGSVKRRVLHAFLEGITCFQFRLTLHNRHFEDRVALPPDADEATALEMAHHHWTRFLNTLQTHLTKH